MSQDFTGTDVFGAPAPRQGAAAKGVERDRWGRYLLPHPETGVKQPWTRVTTMARTLSDEYNLTLWKMRQVAIGVAKRPDLGMLAASADPETTEGKSQLQSICEDAMEVAGSSKGRNLGTALHTFSQKLDLGTLSPAGVPAPYDRDIAAYADTLTAYGMTPDPRYVERIVVFPALGVAGTFDRMIRCPDGLWRIVDLKTAQEVKYSWLEIAVQLAAYGNAPYLWDKENRVYERMPMDMIDTTLGLVLHLPSGQGRCDVYGVDLTEGLRLAYLAVDVRACRSNAKSLAVALPPPTPNPVAPELIEAITLDELPADAVTSAGSMPEYSMETDARQAHSSLLLLRIAAAPDRAELRFIATQCADLWTPETNEAAAKRWAELPA